MRHLQPLHRGPKGRPGARLAGFTLVEITVSLTILIAGLSLLVSSLLSLTRARQLSADRHRVTTVMARAVETLEALGPTDAWLNYGVVGGPGESFVVSGVQSPVQGEGDAQLAITFVTSETVDDPELGLPRDLDGDGAIGNTDVTPLGGDGKILATILPVRVTANWKGGNGTVRTLTWTAVIVEN